jgi:hypothetical protein
MLSIGCIYLPFAAPSTGAFTGNSPSGVRQGGRTLTKGQEALSATSGESEARRRERQPGRLFFGYFLLARQKKVTRFRVREPDSNNRRVSDIFIKEVKIRLTA